MVEETNRLAAAVIAPSFSADGIHAARPCRASDVQSDVCDVVAGVLPAISAVVLAAGLSAIVSGRRSTPVAVPQLATASPRAPPKD